LCGCLSVRLSVYLSVSRPSSLPPSLPSRDVQWGQVDESDPATWKETLAILVTYATADEFASLCDSLATRLKVRGGRRGGQRVHGERRGAGFEHEVRRARAPTHDERGSVCVALRCSHVCWYRVFASPYHVCCALAPLGDIVLGYSLAALRYSLATRFRV